MPAQTRPQEPEYELVQPTLIRQAIGDRTQTSFRDIPQFTMTVLADAEALVTARQSRKQQSEEKITPTYNDYFLKIIASVIGDYPRLNAWRDEEGLKLLKPINLGFACATDEGVLLPTVFDADRKSLVEIAGETGELIEMARRGRLRASLQRWAGFTSSNIGPTQVDMFTAIISPPQTGILAIGSINKRPVAVGDEVLARASVYLTLTADHGALDAAEAAPFLGDIVDRLSDSAWLQQL